MIYERKVFTMKKTHKIFGKEFVTISKEEYEEIKTTLSTMKSIAKVLDSVWYEDNTKAKEIIPALKGNFSAIEILADKIGKNLDVNS
jgi:hypothetical protein